MSPNGPKAEPELIASIRALVIGSHWVQSGSSWPVLQSREEMKRPLMVVKTWEAAVCWLSSQERFSEMFPKMIVCQSEVVFWTNRWSWSQPGSASRRRQNFTVFNLNLKFDQWVTSSSSLLTHHQSNLTKPKRTGWRIKEQFTLKQKSSYHLLEKSAEASQSTKHF